MKRRSFLRCMGVTAAFASPAQLLLGAVPEPKPEFSPEQAQDWLQRWEKYILAEEHNRYCDHEMGEELGWRVSPFLNGFYHGFLATREVRWVELLADWTKAWVRRGVKEPDGFIGWPKSGTGGKQEEDLFTDSLLGEAMALRPVVLMAAEVSKYPTLQTRFGKVFTDYMRLAEATFAKWKARGCWREVKAGGVWVVPAFGIERNTGKWTGGYE